MEATRRRARPGGAGAARARVRRRRSPASSGRSGPTSATSSTSAAPSSSSRSCSTSSNLPKGKRTKTGYSTDASVLEELRPAHPMIGKLLDWRVYTKLRSTYVEALPTLLSPVDGRLHTTFHQAVASTGRLSSSRPEPPEHPDPDRARAADPARLRRGRPGADAARRRLLADRAADPGPRVGRRAPARRRSRQGEDIHRATAARVLHKAPGRRDRRTSARWPRWSTSGSPTG